MIVENDLGIKKGLKDLGTGVVEASEQGDKERAQRYIKELIAGGKPDLILGGATKRASKIVVEHFLPGAQALVDRIQAGEDEEEVLESQLPILVVMVGKLQGKDKKVDPVDDQSLDREDSEPRVLGLDGQSNLQDVKPIRLEKDGTIAPEKKTYASYLSEIQAMLDAYNRQDGSFSQEAFTALLQQAKEDLNPAILKHMLEQLGVSVTDKQ